MVRLREALFAKKISVLYWIFGIIPLTLITMRIYLEPKVLSKVESPGIELKSNAEYNDNGLRSMQEKVNYTEVMMDPLEVDIILKAIKGRKSCLEWGSGGSTLNFPQFISGKVVSIEHDQEWCKTMPARLEKKNILNVDFYCIKTIGQNDIEGTYATFKPYIDKINTLNESRWDFVLIDGRARVTASIRILSYIRSESAVIVHDFERIRSSGSRSYARILTYYDVVDRIGNSVKMDTGDRGIALLRRKTKYDYLEGNHQEVQKMLENIPVLG